MKIPSNFNACGLDTAAKRVRFIADYLFAATQPSPVAVVVKPAQAKGSISPAVVGTGTAANPEFPAVPPTNIAAVSSKVVAPVLAFAGSVSIDDSSAEYTKINAFLPYSPAALAIGGQLTADSIGEISTKSLDLGNYIGDLTNAVPTNFVFPATRTLEQVFYQSCLELEAIDGTTNKIQKSIYQPNQNAPKMAVIEIEVFVGKSLAVPSWVPLETAAYNSQPQEFKDWLNSQLLSNPQALGVYALASYLANPNEIYYFDDSIFLTQQGIDEMSSRFAIHYQTEAPIISPSIDSISLSGSSYSYRHVNPN